jgi:hypothetical protein
VKIRRCGVNGQTVHINGALIQWPDGNFDYGLNLLLRDALYRPRRNS